MRTEVLKTAARRKSEDKNRPLICVGVLRLADLLSQGSVNPVGSASLRSIPIPACETTPRPSSDAFIREPLRYTSPAKCLPVSPMERGNDFIIACRTSPFAQRHTPTP